jgi:hypothetical protein
MSGSNHSDGAHKPILAPMSRRGVLIGAGIAFGSVGVTSASSAIMTSPAAPFLTLYDDRYSQAVEYARAAALRGSALRVVRGDPTDAWYEDLSPEWRQRKSVVEGLTESHTLFVLERMAWTSGMRVTSRRPVAETDLLHWTIAAHIAHPRIGA